jgi:hypothetical protein
MSVFKTTFSRALKVAVTPNCNIPFPNVIVSGTTTDTGSNRLLDNTVDFIKLNVKEGDIVYNIDTYEGATVNRVSSNGTRLDLNANIFDSVGQNYTVYQASPQTGLGNQGCFLYIGAVDTDYEVVTIGGDSVMFIRPTVGAVLPVQVIKVISGGNCVALW